MKDIQLIKNKAEKEGNEKKENMNQQKTNCKTIDSSQMMIIC